MKCLKFFRILFLLGICLSCDGDEDIMNEQILNGIFTESLPYTGTHQLNFADNKTLFLKARNSTDEQFFYQINGNVITLNPIRDLSQFWELEINVISNSKFEIQNIFYASILEDPSPLRFVTFEK